MAVTKVVVVRHGSRLDSENPQWWVSLPGACPSDPPLTDPRGVAEAYSAGQVISDHVGQMPIVIHTSPFLRCVQTAACIVEQVLPQAPQGIEGPVVRLDANLGEFMSVDYFNTIPPPPPDGHRSIADSSTIWFLKNARSPAVAKTLDCRWPVHKFGMGGDYGETFASMNSRFADTLSDLFAFYSNIPEALALVIVTHGAGCNALLGGLLNRPVFNEVALGSCFVASCDDEGKWAVSYRSGDPTQLDINFPGLSLSNSTSHSSMSDLDSRNDEQHKSAWFASKASPSSGPVSFMPLPESSRPPDAAVMLLSFNDLKSR